MDPDINSPRVQQWNVMVERQLGDSWGVSAAYLGSYSDRLWAQTALNPAVFPGEGPPARSRHPRGPPVSSGGARPLGNQDSRRKLTLEDPIKSSGIGALDLNSDVGWQKYRGLKLQARHRSTTGVSLNANYTLSRCKGTQFATNFNQISAGYTDPDNPDFDAGYCDQDRKHVGSLNMGYTTPDVGGVVGALAGKLAGVRASTARLSGSRINIRTGRDDALNGISNQRPNQVSDNIYGAGKDVSSVEPGERIRKLLRPGRLRAAGAGHLRRCDPQPSGGTGVLAG